MTAELPPRIVKSYNEAVLKDSFNIQDESCYFNEYNIPLTIGTLVHKCVQLYIKHNVFKNDYNILLAFAKMGILNPLHKTYTQNQELFTQLTKFKSLSELRTFSNSHPQEYRKLLVLIEDPKVWKYSILQFASTKFLIDRRSAPAQTHEGLQ
jgi:hypothetical protein